MPDYGLTIARLSEEHGVIEGEGVERLRVGQKVPGREEIAEAAFRQMVSLPYYPHTAVNAPAAEFAGMLSELAGAGLEYVYYVNSGTEGNEAAFKLARQYHKQTGQPGRYKIIGRYYGYHGTSMATVAAGGLADRRVQFEPLPQGYLQAPAPYCYRCPFGLTYPSCGVACANYIERMIEAEGPETVAAVVMEPIQSAAGALVPPAEYLPMVAKICKQHGVLLIIDEVINGFGGQASGLPSNTTMWRPTWW